MNEQEKAFLELIDLVDDLDRALALIYSSGDIKKLAKGFQETRERVISRFNKAGFTSFASIGDAFDPQLHQAIAVERGVGTGGIIVDVHQRGWKNSEGQMMRVAMVTVSKGDR